MTWNKKNQQFALSCALRPSTKELLQWILRRANDYEATEKIIDLREFNTWIAKSRPSGKYDHKTIKEAIAQLNESTHGWIVIIRSYSWAVHQIVVFPVQKAIDAKSQKSGKLPKLPTGQPMFDGEHKKRTREQLLQNISKLDSLFKKLGMNYTQDALARIWRMAGKKMSEVENAITYMLKVHAQKLDEAGLNNDEPKGIFKAKGWLHDCIKYGWHQLDEDVELPYVNGQYIPSFVDTLFDTGQPKPT